MIASDKINELKAFLTKDFEYKNLAEMTREEMVAHMQGLFAYFLQQKDFVEAMGKNDGDVDNVNNLHAVLVVCSRAQPAYVELILKLVKAFKKLEALAQMNPVEREAVSEIQEMIKDFDEKAKAFVQRFFDVEKGEIKVSDEETEPKPEPVNV